MSEKTIKAIRALVMLANTSNLESKTKDLLVETICDALEEREAQNAKES